MRASVLPAIKAYNLTHEGYTPFPYCDSFNLVTTGIGNLVDSSARNSYDTSATAMAPMFKLPWKYRGSGWTPMNPVVGGFASQADVAAAFATCKVQEQNDPTTYNPDGTVLHNGFNKRGGRAYAGLTNITLSMDDISTLVANKLAANNATLVKEYPGFETLPADAQMAMHSMAWAMGAAFWPALPLDGKVPHIPSFQAFKDAITNLDFISAAVHSQYQHGGSINDAGNSTHPASRNHDNDIMFRNAAMVVKAGADPDRLIFPGTSSSLALNNPGIASLLQPTAGHIIGGTIAAGLIGYGIFDYLRERRNSK